MDRETLIAYIQTERARGVVDAYIQTELISKGWSAEMVDTELGGTALINSSVLPPVMELISASFDELWKNIWKSFLIMLLPFAGTLILGFMGGVGMMLSSTRLSFTLASLLTVTAVIFLGLSTLVSTIMLIEQVENKWVPTLRQSLMTAFPLVLPLFIVAILASIAILGGITLFIIPGIFATVWFAFAQTATVLDGKRGLSALLYSKELVRGKLFTIFTYYLVAVLLVLFVSFIAGLIPIIGVLIGFFTTPFILIFTVRLYVALKLQKIETVPSTENSATAVYVLLSVGTLLIISILSLILFGLLVLPPV